MPVVEMRRSLLDLQGLEGQPGGVAVGLQVEWGSDEPTFLDVVVGEMACTEIASGSFIVVAFPANGRVAVEVEDGPIGPGAVDFEAVEPRQEVNHGLGLWRLCVKHLDCRDVFTVFGLVEHFAVFPEGGYIVVQTRIIHTVFIDTQGVEAAAFRVRIEHLSVLPDVGRVVGSGDSSPIEASIVGGNGSNVATFDLEDDGVVLPNRTVDGFGAIDKPGRIEVSFGKAEVIDFRPARALPKYRVVLPNAGIHTWSDDAATGIDVGSYRIDGQRIKVACGAVNGIFVKGFAVLPNCVATGCCPSVRVKDNPLDETFVHTWPRKSE